MILVTETPLAGQAAVVMERAMRIAGLDLAQVEKLSLVERGIGQREKFREVFYETIEEPIYTKTGKLSKRTKKIRRPSSEMVECTHRCLEKLGRHAGGELILSSGNETLRELSGLDGIADYRGSVLHGRQPPEWPHGNPIQKLVAIADPGWIARGQFVDFWILASDLAKAKRESAFPEIRREEWVQWTEPTLEQIAECAQEIVNTQSWWTLDVETRAGTLACFALGWRDSNGKLKSICVPVQTARGPFWTPTQELALWKMMREMASRNRFLVNQNLEYDIYYMLRYGMEPSGVWMDTMLVQSILHPEFPKGLDFLCSYWLDDVVYYKGEGRNWKAGDRDQQLWEYNCKDAVYTLRVAEKLDAELKKRGWWERYHGKT